MLGYKFIMGHFVKPGHPKKIDQRELWLDLVLVLQRIKLKGNWLILKVERKEREVLASCW